MENSEIKALVLMKGNVGEEVIKLKEGLSKAFEFDKLDGVTRTLQNQACVLPDAWFRQTSHDKNRLVLYIHGGLNSEDVFYTPQRMGTYVHCQNSVSLNKGT